MQLIDCGTAPGHLDFCYLILILDCPTLDSWTIEGAEHWTVVITGKGIGGQIKSVIEGADHWIVGNGGGGQDVKRKVIS